MRDSEIDIIKGITITLMVFGHVFISGTEYTHLFHMQVFFIITGYLTKDQYFESFENLKQFTVKKFKSLWLPFVTANLIYLWLNNFFLKINFYTLNPGITEAFGQEPDEKLELTEILIRSVHTFFTRRSTELGGATWFLSAMLYSVIFYGVVEFVLNHIKAERLRISLEYLLCIVTIFAVTWVSGWEDHYHGIKFALIDCCKYFWLYFAGKQIRKLGKINPHLFIRLAIIALSMIGLYFCKNYGDVDFESVNPGNVLFCISAPLFGWCLLRQSAYFIKTFLPDKVSELFSKLGRHTLSILLLHFLVFKFINLIIVNIKGYPDYYTAAFPTLVWKQPIEPKTVLTGCVYLVIGLIAPVMIKRAFDLSRKKWFGIING